MGVVYLQITSSLFCLPVGMARDIISSVAYLNVRDGFTALPVYDSWERNIYDAGSVMLCHKAALVKHINVCVTLVLR